jgi:predicted RNase H-like HicB family nuclease
MPAAHYDNTDARAHLFAQVVHEGCSWSAFVPGLPVAADGATFEEAIDELAGAIREYAGDWHDRLRHAQNHSENRGLVQFVCQSDDAQLHEWLRRSRQPDSLGVLEG